jgi:hypothetical protein
MGYRGSKSDFILKSVKEQREDGSWCFWIKHLRCSLMGFERNYPIKIPSKQLNINKHFSTVNTKPILNGWFVSGLADAESTFSTTVFRNKEHKIG